MVARGSDTQDLIVRTALALADEHGVDELSLRALGRATGLHHTAIYRHFADRNAVLQAVAGLLVEEALSARRPLPEDARARITAVLTGIRGVLHDHPHMAATLLLPVAALSDSPAVAEAQTAIISGLREMGLEGDALVLHHRLLDSFVFGSSVFDFGGAPEHLSSRAERLRLTGDADVMRVAVDPSAVDRLNEEAFMLGLSVVLDACEAAGAGKRR